MIALLSAGHAAAADGEPIRLVTAAAYGTHLPGLGEPAVRLAKLLKERSGGAVTLDLKQPGDGTKPDEILNKVASGAIDAGFAPAGFWAAKLPAAALFSGFPFGPDAKLYFDWFEHGNGRKLDQEMYDHAGLKVHVMPCAFAGAESSAPRHSAGPRAMRIALSPSDSKIPSSWRPSSPGSAVPPGRYRISTPSPEARSSPGFTRTRALRYGAPRRSPGRPPGVTREARKRTAGSPFHITYVRRFSCENGSTGQRPTRPPRTWKETIETR